MSILEQFLDRCALLPQFCLRCVHPLTTEIINRQVLDDFILAATAATRDRIDEAGLDALREGVQILAMKDGEYILRVDWGREGGTLSFFVQLGGWGIPALGEIGRCAPDLFAPHVPGLVSMAWDDGLRLEILHALAAVAESAPLLVAEQLDRLKHEIDPSRPEETRAFGRLEELASEGGTS